MRNRVCADVLNEVDVDGDEVAVLVERHSHLTLDVSGLPGGHQVLAPVLDPLHRRGELAGGQHHAHVLAQRDDLLTEPAAGVAHDDPNTLCRQPQQASAERTQLVRDLRGRPDGHLFGGGKPLDDDAARLHRHRHVHVLVNGLGRHVRGRGERLLVGGAPLNAKATLSAYASWTTTSEPTAVVKSTTAGNGS